MFKTKKGITLVALVITIIILLILAGITISQLTGSGLFENARLAEQKTKDAQEKEDGILADYKNKTDSYFLNSSRENTCDHISNAISEFEPTIKQINTTSIKVSVPEISVSNSASIVGYIYFLNGEAKTVSTNTEFTYSNLNMITTYKIRIVAIDNAGKIKSSKEVEVTTKDVIYLYNQGDECTELTGGWKIPYIGGTNSSVGSASKESSYIELKTWGTWCAYGAYTTNEIDFTNIKKIYFDIYDISIENTGYAAANIIIGGSVYQISVGNNTSGIYNFDTTAITGKKSFTISADNGMNYKIRRIFLEE